MIDITRMPSIDDVCDYVGNPAFRKLYEHMIATYKPVCKIEYSKCSLARGWNVKLRKSGKTLCTIYPARGSFTVMVVVGNKERERVEALLPELSAYIQSVYHAARECNGQRWLMIDVDSAGDVYQDVLRLIEIRAARNAL